MRVVEPGFEDFGSFAAGTLDPAFRLVLGARADLHPATSPPVIEANLIGTAFFELGEEVDMSKGALDAALRRIDAEHSAGETGDLPDYLGLAGPELRHIVQMTLTNSAWQHRTPGHRYIKLQVPGSTLESNGGGVYLIELDAGCSARSHRHLGEEYTLLLKGHLESQDEGPVSDGQLVHREKGSVHAPRASAETDCALLLILTGGFEYLPIDSDAISA